MYEIGSDLYGRRKPVWRSSQTELRRLLRMPDRACTSFAELRRRVLEPTQEDIGKLADFTMTWRAIKKGYQVDTVEIWFAPKGVAIHAGA
jgi:plasmid replication initiation protein